MEPLRFTAEQCAKLKFPIGCPVWYNLSRTEDDAAVEVPSTFFLKCGVVQSAIWSNNKLFYEVTYVDESRSINITEEVEDGTLGFGATCPVTILPDNSATDPLEGEIVLCTPSTADPNGFVYTAMIFLDGTSKVRYEGGIEEKRVVYRKVESDGEGREKNAGGAAVGKSEDADDKAGAEPACQLSSVDANVSNSSSKKKEYGNSSIMKTKNSGSYDDDDDDEDREIIEEPMRSPLPHSIAYSDSHTPREKAGDESMSSSRSGPSKLEILVPLWLQKDRASQRSLFFHIIGANGCNTKRIEHEARCKVHIVTSEEAGPFVPMKIYVDAMNVSTALRDLKVARQMIQSILLKCVGDDGSRGRLIYEVAQSCWGAHRPNQSTSNAVKDFNPLYNSEQQVFMSVVEFPFVCEEGGKKIFHAAQNVLRKGSLAKIQASGCFVLVVKNGYRISTDKSDPYVFVYGQTYRGVDKAVDTVKHVIRGHQRTCSCNY